ncbi:AAA family ATPase [Streptomyces sp. 71268]|uniref:AAA family ATPase n=1 Tax=Streptomyces sp. 71268 TaxID=3002640 RepID=UPI0023F6F141|nr:AAA family ATPase [Streptomyces sp. 71268]WEV26341.1 AAA family ATPase [Streptomyces sp. 71268]
MTVGGEFRDGIAERITRFDRAGTRRADEAEVDRRRVLDMFPLESWPQLRLEQYALGPATHRTTTYTFCRLLEYGTSAFGSIRGGSAAKHIIFQHRTGEWRVVPAALRALGVEEAWRRLRGEFVAAFEAAREGAYERIDELEALSYGQALTTKALALYFPDAFLPIFSAAHVRHFTELLGGRPRQHSSGVRTWQANRELLTLVRAVPEFDGWRPHEVMAYLYAFHDPRPRDRVIWKIAPGRAGKLWDDCLANARMRTGWDEVGSLGQYESDLELKEALDQHWPHSTGGNLRLARQLLAFRDLEPGDVIVANRGKSEVLAVGTVTDGYSYATDVPRYRHAVGVVWDTSYAQHFDSPRHAWQQTFAKVPAPLWQEIRRGRGSMAEGGAEPTAGADVELPAAVRTVRDLLQHKGQVILQGPPGTGKTRLALSVALAIAGRADQIDAPPQERAAALAELSEVPPGAPAARLTMVTFHPSYGYEDFVEGFKPVAVQGAAGLHLAMTDGLFRRVCAAAQAAPDETYLIVVDEINRGDLPRILGELITLLELDKRDSIPITLPTSGRQQTVPANVRIIGTMNSADRSVGHIDSAIRRRFAFVDVPPDLDVLDGEVGGLGLASLLEGLNDKLESAFGPDHMLGQSYLLADDQPIGTAEQLAHAFHHEIVPLVADYCLGQPDLLRSVLGSLVDDHSGRVVHTNPQDLPGVLADEFVAGRVAGEDDDTVSTGE